MSSSKSTSVKAAALLAAATLSSHAVVFAQSTSVVTHWCPELWHPTQRIYASVINANPTATTYSIDCGYGTAIPDLKHEFDHGCSQNPTVIYTLGPKTVDGRMIRPEKPFDFTRGFDCDVFGTTTASCDFILDGRAAEAQAQTGRWPNDPDEYTGTDFDIYYQPFTITAGLEKLSGGGGSGSGGNGVVVTTTTTAGSPAETTPAGTGSAPLAAGAQETGAGSSAATGNAAVPTSGAGKQMFGKGMVVAGVLAAFGRYL
ncbi:hypothetical protein QBC43DRAFT_330019 [Cladorrhinum sp. PSN259]|nr:hypothetical protein QBC43DRAFT_330019 [Cladorrhinum sp. PSN259]